MTQLAMIRFKPKATAEEPTTIFAATFGRGIWTYELPAVIDPPPGGSGSGGSSSGGGSDGASEGRFGGSLGGASLLGLAALLALRRRRPH